MRNDRCIFDSSIVCGSSNLDDCIDCKVGPGPRRVPARQDDTKALAHISPPLTKREVLDRWLDCRMHSAIVQACHTLHCAHPAKFTWEAALVFSVEKLIEENESLKQRLASMPFAFTMEKLP